MQKFNEDEVKQLLSDLTCWSANELINEKIPTMEKRMTKAVKNLASLLAEVKQTFPEAMLYTASGGLCLLLGADHDENGKKQQDLVALGFHHIISIGDGDW